MLNALASEFQQGTMSCLVNTSPALVSYLFRFRTEIKMPKLSPQCFSDSNSIWTPQTLFLLPAYTLFSQLISRLSPCLHSTCGNSPRKLTYIIYAYVYIIFWNRSSESLMLQLLTFVWCIFNVQLHIRQSFQKACEDCTENISSGWNGKNKFTIKPLYLISYSWIPIKMWYISDIDMWYLMVQCLENSNQNKFLFTC